MADFLAASPVTVVIILAAFLVTPLHLALTFLASGADFKRVAAVGAGALVWGALMGTVCVFNVSGQLGPLGALVVPVAWAAPSIIIWLARGWLRVGQLSQKWLVGLQVWRIIGGVFIIEHLRGNLPGIFAWPAGIGDIIAGLLAAIVLLRWRASNEIPRLAVLAVAVVGILDFLSAMFFGLGSSAGPLQIFQPEVPNRTLLFPTGFIPLVLVPYAIMFHTMSLMQLGAARRTRGPQAAAFTG